MSGELEELEYELAARHDYLREAYGGEIDVCEDEPWDDQMPGGVYSWQGADAFGRALHLLASAWHWHCRLDDDGDVPF